MANPNKPKGKAPSNNSNRNKQQPPVYKREGKAKSTFDNLNSWFDNRGRNITIFIFVCSALFSVLLFQARMDIGGDDSAYLQRAYDFVHKGIFPAFQGPLYPLMLSLFVAPFGINIILLKALSLVFNIVGLYFFYKAFKGRVPSLVFYPVLFITAVNSYILNFASLTYNEAFFMCLQYIFFYLFFNLLDKLNDADTTSIKDTYRNWLLPGFLLFALILTRNIAITALGGVVLFFVINKQYRNAIFIVGVFLLYEIPMMGIEKLFKGGTNQWGSQGDILLLKDPYDASKGKEDIGGFITRFLQNCDIYISKRFFEILGFRSQNGVDNYTPFESGALGLFVLLLLAIVGFIIYRLIKSKNKYLLAAFLYSLSIAGTSFLVLQIRWDQPRIIMVCVPVFLLAFFYALYDVFKSRSWGIQFLLVVVINIFALVGIGSTLGKVNKNISTLSKNLHGDIYAGYTQDWVNFLKMSRWCADSLPNDGMIASRKASMSFVYGRGREFFSVNKVYYTDADSIMAFFKKNNVKYFMLPSLRLHPDQNTGEILNTMQNTLAPIYKKYQNKVKFIRREGSEEPTDLFEVDY